MIRSVRKGWLTDAIPILCAAAAVLLFFYMRGGKPRRASRAAVAIAPTSRLRFEDEAAPLWRRWRELDEKTSAAAAVPEKSDWPLLLADGIKMLGRVSEARLRLGRDMAGLVPGMDVETGQARERSAEKSLSAMEDLGDCTMELSQRMVRLHRALHEKSREFLKLHRAQEARYARTRRACRRAADQFSPPIAAP